MTHDEKVQKVAAAVSELLHRAEPSNDAKPLWRRIEAEAVSRGFPSTRAFRTWCLARGVTVRETSQRDTWVCPAEVDRVVAAMPAVAPPKRASGPASEFDDDIKRGVR